MPSVPNQSRSRRWGPFRPLTVVSAGLGLLAVVAAAIYLRDLGIQVPEASSTSSATAGVAAGAADDFATSTCSDLDVSEFTEMAGGRAELVDARAQVYPDAFPEGGVGNLYCQFSSESGMTFSVGVLANTAEDFAATSTERNRAVWELVPDDYLIEDFQSGVLEGYTNTHESATLQEFTLNAGSGRLLLTIALIADPGTFANTDAIAVVDAIAARTVERFAEYR